MVETIPKLKETLLDIVRQLPPDRQRQVVDFVRFLELRELIEKMKAMPNGRPFLRLRHLKIS